MLELESDKFALPTRWYRQSLQSFANWKIGIAKIACKNASGNACDVIVGNAYGRGCHGKIEHGHECDDRANFGFLAATSGLLPC